MRTGAITFLVVLLGTALALALTNPGPDDFQRFAEDQLEDVLVEQLGEEPLGRALAGAGSRFAGPLIRDATERENRLLFSRYTLTLGPSSTDEQAWVFIGVGGRFVEWQRPAGLDHSDE